jgi:hypothetical protein
MAEALKVVDGGKAKPAKRKAISQKTRFEVFKRDGFKCQYCGKCAPDVILNVDHIHPVSKGGEDDMMNYITSCFDCNSGKSDRLLTDDSVVAKQRAQLEELNVRREQLEMMLQWRDGLKAIDEESLEKVSEAWEAVATGYFLNDNGLNSARKLIKSFGLVAVLDAIDTAGRQYIKYGDSGNAQQDSVDKAWSKIGGICRIASQPESMRKLYYARGILRNRVYVNEGYVMPLMKEAVEKGMDPESILELAKVVRNWTDFKNELESWSE